MSLSEELERIAAAALAYAAPAEEIAAVIPAEPAIGVRVYLCAFQASEARSWIALDEQGHPVHDRRLLRDAVSIAAICELAEETAAGGDLPELQAQLAELAETEGLDGLAEAEAAAAALAGAIEGMPRVASAAYLDRVGRATRRLEQALGGLQHSPLAEGMQAGAPAVEGLVADVEAGYKLGLD